MVEAEENVLEEAGTQPTILLEQQEVGAEALRTSTAWYGAMGAATATAAKAARAFWQGKEKAAVDMMEEETNQEEQKPLTDLSQDSPTTPADEAAGDTHPHGKSNEVPAVTMPPDGRSSNGPPCTPPKGWPQTRRQWMYTDWLDGHWRHWQMVDEAHHDKLETWAAGEAEVELTHVTHKGKEWKWWANPDAKTQTRWRGHNKGSNRQLMQVDMAILEGSGPLTHTPNGFKYWWQYQGPWGWKNVEETPNQEIIAAQARDEASVTITHVWENHRLDKIMHEKYTINFHEMNQVALQGNQTKRAVRLVAWREVERVGGAPSSSQ